MTHSAKTVLEFLARLNASPTAKVAESIVFLLTLYKAAPPGTWSDQIPCAEDSVSKSILTLLAHVLERYTPHATVGYWNRCFREVSLALYNTEEHHGYARLMAACKMIQHPEFYDVFAPSSLLALSSVTIEGTYVDLIHIFAISSALDVTIQSYTPPTNVCGLETSPYTHLIAGRAIRQAKATAMTLMWTVPRNGQPFTPNHIVLLVERLAGSRVTDVNDSMATFDYDGCEAAGGADVSTCEQDDNDATDRGTGEST